MRHSDSGQARRVGKHRARPHRRQPYAWLGAGAVTLGIGAVLAGGSAVAYADTGAGSAAGKASSGSSESSSTASSAGDSTTTKKPAAQSARSTVTSSGGNLSSRKVSTAAVTNASAAAAVESTATTTATATATAASTGHSARVHTTTTDSSAAASDTTSTTTAASTAAGSTPVSYSWLSSATPTVADVAVNLAQQQITQAQTLLQQQTWGSGNVAAGLVAVIPQMLLSQAAWALTTWGTATPAAQASYSSTAGIPIVHQLAGIGLLGALLLPSVATTALSGAALFLPLVGAFEGTNSIATVENYVSTATQNGRVYALVPVSMQSTTEPIVYISINGGPSIPVLVDTGSSGLVVTASSVGSAVPLGAPTGTGTSGYSGGLSYTYTTYTTTVDFGNGIVTEPTSVDIVDAADAKSALAFFNQLGGADGVLGIGADAAGPGPTVPTTALPGDLSQGVFLYQGLFLGIAGVMVFGPNPLPSRTSVSGAPDANLQVKINNGSAQTVGAIIDSGGVYGTILLSVVGAANTHVVTDPFDPTNSTTYVNPGTTISVYTTDGVLLYSYTVTSQNEPMVITSGLINTGYVPYESGPVYIDYTAPGGQGSTVFDYA
jgi:hypothetical protein